MWRTGAVGVGVALVIALAGCGGGPTITASTTCGDFLGFPAQERRDALTRLAVEAGLYDAGSPLLAPGVEYECGIRPTATVGDILAAWR